MSPSLSEGPPGLTDLTYTPWSYCPSEMLNPNENSPGSLRILMVCLMVVEGAVFIFSITFAWSSWGREAFLAWWWLWAWLWAWLWDSESLSWSEEPDSAAARVAMTRLNSLAIWMVFWNSLWEGTKGFRLRVLGPVAMEGVAVAAEVVEVTTAAGGGFRGGERSVRPCTLFPRLCREEYGLLDFDPKEGAAAADIIIAVVAGVDVAVVMAVVCGEEEEVGGVKWISLSSSSRRLLLLLLLVSFSGGCS